MDNENNITPEILDKHLSAMSDSISFINSEIEKAEDSDESKDSIRRNYQHLEIMLDKGFIRESESDLSEAESAITAAKTYLGD